MCVCSASEARRWQNQSCERRTDGRLQRRSRPVGTQLGSPWLVCNRVSGGCECWPVSLGKLYLIAGFQNSCVVRIRVMASHQGGQAWRTLTLSPGKTRRTLEKSCSCAQHRHQVYLLVMPHLPWCFCSFFITFVHSSRLLWCQHKVSFEQWIPQITKRNSRRRTFSLALLGPVWRPQLSGSQGDPEAQTQSLFAAEGKLRVWTESESSSEQVRLESRTAGKMYPYIPGWPL